MKPIRIAILGFGKIAEDQHVPSITGNPRFDLVATSSRSGHGVAPIFTDWRELIRSVEGLEAVAITTPPGPRYEMARECILAGLHCLLEKPPTAGLAQIADLDCLAQAQGISLFATWHAQHHSTVDAAAKALAGKRIAGDGNPVARGRPQMAPGSATGFGSPAGSACSIPESTPSRSRRRSFPAACSCNPPSLAFRRMRRPRSPPT